MTRIYRLLLKLYPARFREEYTELMECDFRDEYGEARGRLSRLLLLLRVLIDLATTVPLETAHEVSQDFRYAARAYRRRAVTTALAIIALSTAIGITTGIFSVLNAVMIRSLPFHEPEKLVELRQPPVSVMAGRAAVQAWSGGSPYLKEVASYTANEMNVVLGRDAARAKVTETTSNFFSLLGSEPEFGRGFAPDEDIPGRNNVAVISHNLWQQQFGGDRSMLGGTLRLNGVPFTIVGVAPQGFDYPEKTTVWIPTIYDLDRIPKEGVFSWITLGRLRPDVEPTQAASMFDAEVKRAAGGSQRPKIKGFASDPQLLFLGEQLSKPVRSVSLVLMGLVVFVLLVACANLAHLVLSRTTERRRELAVRAALGASRGRLIQQLTTEATVLTAFAAVLGVGVAYWTTQLASSVLPAALEARPYTLLDWRVVVFTAGLALLTGVIFGAVPVSLIGRLQPGGDVTQWRGESRGFGTGATRTLLIAMQTAVTVVLVAGAFSLGSSLLRLTKTDLAFSTQQVVTLNVSLAGTRYEHDGAKQEYVDRALERLGGLSGVESASVVSNLPLIQRMFMGGLYKLDSGEQAPMAVLIAAGPGYFRTMRTEILEGREFTPADRKGAEPVVVVSDEFAKGFGRGSILGRKLNLSPRGSPTMATIVGVVRSQRHVGPMGPGPAQVYRPVAQWASGHTSFVVRVKGDPEAHISACRDALQDVDKGVPVFDVRSLNQRLADVLAKPRFFTAAVLCLSAFALLLAVIGTYGVTSYYVSERKQEIGVRVAMGATPARVRMLMLRQGMAPVWVGIGVGVVASVGLARFLQYLVVGAEPVAGWISAAAACALAGTVGFAIWIATTRVARVDPIIALKAD